MKGLFLDGKNKIDNITAVLKEFSLLIGKYDGITTLPTINDLPIGLNMETEAKVLEDLVVKVEQRIFNLTFIGEFTSGRRTIINSLIGRRILPLRAVAWFPISTLLVYGKGNCAKVYFKDHNMQPEVMSYEEFFEKYKLSPEDAYNLDGTELLISHVVIEIDNGLLENGVKLVNTPALSEFWWANEPIKKFVSAADTVIFVLSAIKLFSRGEREFIQENFAGKCMENVFFIVNRMNQLQQEDVPRVKDYTKCILKDVFFNKNGMFDEELYNQRVFFVNAFDALKAKEEGNNKKLQETGMLSFEEELYNYLNGINISPFFNYIRDITSGIYEKTQVKINSLLTSGVNSSTDNERYRIKVIAYRLKLINEFLNEINK